MQAWARTSFGRLKSKLLAVLVAGRQRRCGGSELDGISERRARTVHCGRQGQHRMRRFRRMHC